MINASSTPILLITLITLIIFFNLSFLIFHLPKRMTHDIRYKGLSFTPDALATPQGSLSLAANAEIRDGAVCPAVLTGTTIPPLLDNYDRATTLKFIHTTSDGSRFITIRKTPPQTTDSYINWFDQNGTWEGNFDIPLSKVNECQIEAVGNTLIIVDDSGVYFALWKHGTYTLLGQKPPFPVIQFSLERDTTDNKNIDDHEVSVDGGSGSGGMLIGSRTDRRDIKKEYRTTVTEQVMAKINHRIDKVTDLGCFYAPFLIRYALRLYDGTSLILHSPPVLLFPLLRRSILTAIKEAKVNGVFDNTKKEYKYYIYLRRAILKYRCLDLSNLQDWGDIVKSVDIFITPQFSRIDNSKTIDGVSFFWNDRNESLLGGNDQQNPTDFETTYQGYSNQYSFELPECSESEMFGKIHNAAEFFLLAKLEVAELEENNSFKEVPFQPSILKNITAQQLMTDDYKSHNLMLPNGNSQRHNFTYNHRLHLYGMMEQPFAGFPPEVLFPYCNSGDSIESVTVTLNADDVTQNLVTAPVTNTVVPDWLLRRAYKFYPDTRAVEMSFKTSGSPYYFKCKLQPHVALNGAYALYEENKTDFEYVYGDPPESSDVIPLPLPNKLYQSEVNNPFVFKPSSIYTVGMGTILAVAPATRALSQGQFGQFPVIAFSTDGIWTMEVSSDGTFLPPKSISREVCTNPLSICQLDQQIAFATKRGLSILRGQDVIPISDQLDGPAPDVATLFPQLASFFANEQGDNSTTQANKAKMRLLINANSQHPVSFFQTANVLYDFANQRLIVTPPPAAASGNVVAFVYSLNDQAWSTMAFPVIRAAVPAYPHPYIQLSNDGSLLCLDTPNTQATPSVAASQHPVLFLTRPLSFGDGMYSLDGFIHNTHFFTPPLNRGAWGVFFLFGSNDLSHWHYIGRTNQPHVNYLPSHAYRYFCLGIYALLTPPDRYISTSLNIKEKLPKL